MKKQLIFIIIFVSLFSNLLSQSKNDDREYWTDLAYKISAPILENMSKGELKKNMTIELSPTWDGRDKDVSYTEAFGRLMDGIAPWLALPDDKTAEGKQRSQLKKWALASYANAVNPNNPDYLPWQAHSQTLVDAAYIANSFMRAPQALWEPLDQETKDRYIKEFKGLRKIRTPYNNWVLFRAMVEAFLLSIDEDYDGFALDMGLRKMEEWYLADGWYADGPEFSLDYYNSYVIHPMVVEIVEVLKDKNKFSCISFDLALRRMQRYNQLMERLISPEGTFPAMGRSMTYRMGAFQSLALAAWKYDMPENVTNGQLRSALTTVMRNMFDMPDNFTEDGYLRLGFVGHQPEIADYYTNNGSLYITSLVFLPLGLSKEHPFWSDEAQDWTSKRAWKGLSIPKDYHTSIKK